MGKARLSLDAALTLIIASTTLVFHIVCLSSASTPATNANPRILYWPEPQIGEYNGQFWFYPRFADVYGVMWFPSGQKILVINNEQSKLKAIVINASTMQPIYNFWAIGASCGFMKNSFAISPDETKIFFGNISSDRNYLEIISVNLDGTNPTFITRINGSLGTFVDVARDGTFLVYTEGYHFYDPLLYQERDVSRIKKFDFNTRETSLILEFYGVITSLRVSPSNDKLAFTSWKGFMGNGYDGVYIVNLDGTNLTRVTNLPETNTALSVSWMPNGTMLTFSEVSNEVLTNYNAYSWRSNLTAINTDGSNKHVIYNDIFSGSLCPTNDSLMIYIKFSDIGGFKFIPYILNLNLPITPDPDSDGDGLSDFDEIRNSLNPCDPTDIYKDYDNDGLTNLEEINYGTYLANPDCDGDGLSDGVEVKVFRTDPTRRDTDGDGISDGLEAAATGLNAFVSVLPDGWIRMQLEWKDKRMYVSTNSSVLGVVFDSQNMALTVSVGGPDGSTGIANITIPLDMISSLSAVKVTLDNQPIDFQISQMGNYAQIYVQYHHSFHDLTAHLKGGSGGSIGGVDLTGILGYWWLILSVAIVAVASIIALIIVKRG
jgi:Tol biopolymer transport system component